MKKQKDKFDLFAIPFSVDANSAPHELQMEINEYVAKSTYPHLHDNARPVVCMFGSTYCCEQLFSKMNYAKNKLRNRLSDRHLNDVPVLQISSTKLPVHFNA